MASTGVPHSLATARRILRRYLRRWGVSHTALRVNARLVTTLARCLPASQTVEVSPALLSRDARTIREVLCHEAAHLAVHSRHGETVRPHGPEWQELVRQARFAPRATLFGSTCGEALIHEERRRPRPLTVYRHRCPVCHFVRTAKRPVPQWRCRECLEAGLDGRLVISGATNGAK